MTCAKKWRSLRSWMVPGAFIVSAPETECRRSSAYKLMQLHIYMPPAARRHLANMNILHGDFRSFGDNVTSRTMAAIVSAPATRGRSRLGGALISRAKVRYFVRTV